MSLVPWMAVLATTLLVSFFLLEQWFPLRERTRSLWRRLIVNIVVTALALAVGSLLVRPLAASAMGFNEDRFGLLGWSNLPGWIEGTIGFALMDLSFYYWHLANHRIPFLWRFHNVHHIDPDLDVSTAFRFHFGEMAFSAGFRVFQVVLIGVSPWTYVVYEIVFQSNTLFHHSNLRLPIKSERLLNKILVTPRMHGIHHSQVQRETNSNYSVVFPWWDRLHRSLRLNVPQNRLTIGVPGYSSPEDNQVWKALSMPFVRQKEYWLTPEGKPVERSEEDLEGERKENNLVA